MIRSEVRRQKDAFLKEKDKEARESARKAVKTATETRRAATQESRAFCRTVKKERHADAETECLDDLHKRTRGPTQELDRARRDRDALAAIQRVLHQRNKSTRRSRAPERHAEERQAAENDVRHHMGREWAQVFSTWRPPARKAGDSRSLYELFSEWAHDNPEALDRIRERNQKGPRQADLDCAQARLEAERGNFEAEVYHGQHCDGDKAKRKPKGSAASRTESLFGKGNRK